MTNRDLSQVSESLNINHHLPDVLGRTDCGLEKLEQFLEVAQHGTPLPDDFLPPPPPVVPTPKPVHFLAAFTGR